MRRDKHTEKGGKTGKHVQNTPRGGKWASKFEDVTVKGGKGDVHAKKALGQHFLTDESIAQRIADLVDDREQGWRRSRLRFELNTAALVAGCLSKS